MGKLYLCGTPIGNLEDITLRAVRILKEVDIIAAEDTRHTKILLDRYGIKTPLTSYHKFNIRAKTGNVIDLIKQGRSVALVSDAGMPGISDPGHELVKGAVEEGVEVVPIPGPTALIAALASSGLPTNSFVFEGFLPSGSSERKKVLSRLKEEQRTMVFYEAPHRINKVIKDMEGVFGSERQCVIGREITKKFEEFKRGNIGQLVKSLGSSKLKGEFVIVVEGKSFTDERLSGDRVFGLISDLIRLGISKKDISRVVSAHSGLNKNQVYDMVLKA